VFRILVVGPSWIGDTLLAQPLFKLLHALHSELALDVLAPPWTLPLVARMPEVRRAIPSPFRHGELQLGVRRQLARELAAEAYEQAIVLPNSLKSALIPFLAGIPRRTGYLGEWRLGLLNEARRLDKHAMPLLAQRYAALAGNASSAAPHPLPDVHLAVDDASRSATLRRLNLNAASTVVVLCPGAEYGPAKRWPPHYFGELAREVSSRGGSVWIVGAANDAPLGADIARTAGAGCVDLCGRTTLDEAIDVIASADVVVANDSGLMHVAAAVGRPLVALYGSTSPAYTPPLAADADILKLDLACSPCFKRECPLRHFDCMMRLAPSRVLAAPHFARMRWPNRTVAPDAQP
jgi:heptosyltransferase-2